ncbi:hypothetical protein [Kineosporia sp. NBRC 101731]|uniref:hypothetical protein n=1 Tax=Kineosporia sp. NBRC 101731 TaxID=3032199 RepID=UPI0024A48C40|nr:hypothetical protein [Kineosporia sp. NBRC 101731]GLY32550.1 hypothetical protein Kisp02_59150 [Kineosporia sp. NBRC 101731]
MPISGFRLRGRSAEFWVACVGTLAGIIGAAAAVAVFVVPAKTGDASADPPTSTSGALPSAGSTQTGSSPSQAPVATASDIRYLTDLSPKAGVGFLETEGRNLRLSCPTNQSDDVQHEVTYALPAAYSQFSAEMTVGGEADPEATASVQVFIQRRSDRNDIRVQVGDPIVLKQQARTSFTRPLGEAVQLVLRVRCTSRTQIVELKAPQLTR